MTVSLREKSLTVSFEDNLFQDQCDWQESSGTSVLASGGEDAGKKNTWAELAAGCDTYEEGDPEWERAIRALESGVSEAPVKGEIGEHAVRIYPVKMEEELSERAESLSGAGFIKVSPSMLEQWEEQTASEKSGQAETANAGGESPQPHGARWGTVVHRLLELSIRQAGYEKEQRANLAIQAVYETLAGEELTQAERKQLDPMRQYPSEDLLFEALTDTAVVQTAFLEEPDSELRKILKSGRTFTELPFQLVLPGGDDLRELCGRMIPEQEQRPAELRGVIDLAVLDENGWTLVDYKTDSVREGESRNAYIERLQRQYRPQLQIYREILNRIGKGTVQKAYLCAVNLNGVMIELS